ncbi:MAG TPA: HAD-IB family hydrolase [Mycobacterium sp.]|uniref:HAD-IB family hydrolase n=1 Tax=Mycobacterium sp. TaxID=1785 RepID=UPI002D37AE3B|nr:HAD-IB family hydrolase [Mycobacterium sp.]HXY64041.1 HAD-IB family hydrolase [Mycobacterium sp.]
MSFDELVESIRNGPSGRTIGAVFDYRAVVDRVERGPTKARADDFQAWAGCSEDAVRKAGQRRFNEDVAAGLFHGMWGLVRAHINRGHTVVLVASEPWFDVEPLARELGVEHLLCTELEAEQGVLTGRPTGQPLVGLAKSTALREFAAREGIDLGRSHAYAHSDEDISLLESVGFAHQVNPAPALAQHGIQTGWTTLEFRGRRDNHNPIPVVRTAAMYGSLVAAAGAGFATGVAARNRRRGVDVATWLFGRAGTSLGNISVDLIGAEHLWSQRPAVFFANHQSTLIDVLVTARILRQGFTIVAKAEVRQMPVIGKLFELADVAFVDRGNTASAISALQPAVDKLRSGTSIAMSPEGTRSVTPTIGQFKKGGFHLARDAEVPIVPIVIRNAGEIMWRNARIAQSGTVEVTVHEPVPTAGWTREDIEPWLNRMRELYIDTLDDWPGIQAGQRWSKAIANSTAKEY